ncbi:MAG: transposase [Candidatus Omnitrophota bacterium]|nr:transposase [Candidatus Omnitrophota bacterium]
MPRSSRIFIDYACYHIIIRGNQKQNIFYIDENYQKYLSMLKKAKRKYEILSYAYCLMTNHIHLLIDSKRSRNISKFMHWLNRGYTAYFNTQYRKTGHLWQGRFRSHPIIRGQYLINVATYIENNPVRAGIVNDPADYKWSSYRERCLLSKKYILDPIKVDCSFSS